MSDLDIVHSEVDVFLLKKLIEASIALLASKNNATPASISAYAKSDIANSSRIIYQYLIRNSTDDRSKLREINDSVISSYSQLVCQQYNALQLYRSKSMSKGMRTNSEFSYSLESALTYMIVLVSPLSKSNPALSLMPDLFKKFYTQALGLLRMLNLDLASEAYSNWRTLHEAECVIKLLVEGGTELQSVYLRHLVYNNAFRHAIASVEETDKVFVEIKAEMAKHGLKSKDMKKFIEYGWLYACKTYHEDNVEYKLNFRNGLQKAAGLEEYNQWYEMASEMAHSSPIFFYSNNDFFSDLTAVNLADISIRSMDYFNKYLKDSNIALEGQDKTFMEILNNTLNIQVKKEDDSFYTKYKDYLDDDSPDDSKGESED